MIRRPPRSTRTDTLFPYTTLFRSALAERLAAGEIGQLETLHIVNHDPETPSLDFIPGSGGLFKDFTIHDFDLVAWLMDEPIVEVFAAASCLIDPRIAGLGDVDTAKTELPTTSGSLCTIPQEERRVGKAVVGTGDP